MTTRAEPRLDEPRPFAIAQDPFLRLLRRLRLTRGADYREHAWALVVIAWVPLMLGALLGVALGDRPAPILLDLSVHVRLVIGIPLLILAEWIFAQRCHGVIQQLYRSELADRAAVDRIIDRAERLRDARSVEISFLVLVLLAGQAVLWKLVGATGLVAGISDPGELSFARLWYVTVALPIAHFLLLRWLWHWSIWSYVLVRLSRLPLATIATHPDHAGGIGFLSGPIAGFAALVLEVSTLMAAAWGTQIFAGDAAVRSFLPSFVAFLIVSVVVAVWPLLLFVPMLYQARRRGIAQYSGFALAYVREFHGKWIEPTPGATRLGERPDVQSLNDLMGAYEALVRIRLVPFGARAIMSIWVAAVLPMIPLIATAMPLHEMVHHVGRAALGGLPV